MRSLMATLSVITLLPSLAVADGFDEAQLERLFTSETARSEIDRRRDQQNVSSTTEQTGKSPATIKVNGIVRRSDGKNTVWVNGRSVEDRSTSNGVRVVSRGDDDTVSVFVDGEKVRMKPGETWSQKQSANR